MDRIEFITLSFFILLGVITRIIYGDFIRKIEKKYKRHPNWYKLMTKCHEFTISVVVAILGFVIFSICTLTAITRKTIMIDLIFVVEVSWIIMLTVPWAQLISIKWNLRQINFLTD